MGRANLANFSIANHSPRPQDQPLFNANQKTDTLDLDTTLDINLNDIKLNETSINDTHLDDTYLNDTYLNDPF